MGIKDIVDLLEVRVGWDQEIGFPFTLTSQAKESASGLFFQDGHAFVKLETIQNLQNEDVEIDEPGFNAYLIKLRRRCVTQVVSDALQVVNVHEGFLVDRINIFDDAISKRMAITVGEMVSMSNRSNGTERLNKDQIQAIFFELNGNSAGSRYNPNMPMYVGLKDKYGASIRKLQDLTQQVKTLDTFSLATPNYDIQFENDILWYGK